MLLCGEARYFLAEITVYGAIGNAGIRREAYKLAVGHAAYVTDDNKHSIYYSNANLEIRLLFVDMRNAHRFVNNMLKVVESSQLTTTHCERYATVMPDFTPQLMLTSDYDPSEYPEPMPVMVVPTPLTEAQSLMTLERRDHDDFRGLPAFCCHLIGESVDATYAGCESNILYMTWSMHQRFNGLNGTTKNVPSIAIRFVRAEAEKGTLPGGLLLQRAILTIECLNRDTFEVISARLKEPFTPSIDALEIETYIFPADLDTFIDCVTCKYAETRAIWGQEYVTPGQLVDEETAADLRAAGARRAREALVQRRAAKGQRV
jgi:hypothetical protein